MANKRHAGAFYVFRPPVPNYSISSKDLGLGGVESLYLCLKGIPISGVSTVVSCQFGVTDSKVEATRWMLWGDERVRGCFHFSSTGTTLDAEANAVVVASAKRGEPRALNSEDSSPPPWAMLCGRTRFEAGSLPLIP